MKNENKKERPRPRGPESLYMIANQIHYKTLNNTDAYV